MVGDKVALVTAGGSGMGAEAARRGRLQGGHPVIARKGEALAQELGGFDLPGWIDSLAATEERRQGVPMQRYGTSQEIAGHRRLPGLGGRRLHHGPEPPRGWQPHRTHPVSTAAPVSR